MAWVKLNAGEPVVRVRKNGQIRWNTATHIMLGNPESVEIYYDAARERLGLRGVYWFGALRALYNEDMEYGIDAGDHLADAGFSFNDDWEATPEDMPPGDVFPGPLTPGPDDPNAIWIAIP